MVFGLTSGLVLIDFMLSVDMNSGDVCLDCSFVLVYPATPHADEPEIEVIISNTFIFLKFLRAGI